ncbi:uncharacterized protein EI97DRAFT_459414 [Westerdykella ornata]|uniref:Uncharacterized protein n=1 Tax=Westerdykella ornata TaxID=318751 RepID=A0A6A6JGX9_WESOR|nr:uncharacterized protein EI97DRAFT_459414 [Westerdykella ornata]KAF2275515.1 hypothetical protein EI97DRAFT_459414 [Westerdykella ornata]
MAPKRKRTDDAGPAKPKKPKTNAPPPGPQAQDVQQGSQSIAVAPTAPSQSATAQPAFIAPPTAQVQPRSAAPTRKTKQTDVAGPSKSRKPRTKPAAPQPEKSQAAAEATTTAPTAPAQSATVQSVSTTQSVAEAQTQRSAPALPVAAKRASDDDWSHWTLEQQIDREVVAREIAARSTFIEQGTLAYPNQVYLDSGVRAAIIDLAVQAGVERRLEERQQEKARKEAEEAAKQAKKAQGKADKLAAKAQGTKKSTRKGAGRANAKGKKKAGDNEQADGDEKAEAKDKEVAEEQSKGKDAAGGDNMNGDQRTGEEEEDPVPKDTVPTRVWIVIDPQEFYTLYGKKDDHPIDHAPIPKYRIQQEIRLPDHKEGLDRATLMKYSREAYDFFIRNPSATELHLPVRHPDVYSRSGEQVAYIGPGAMRDHIIPWLSDREREKAANKKCNKKSGTEKHGKDNGSSPSSIPALPPIPIPDGLEDKIHLYNTMLQLAMPRRLQHELIKALCRQIYCTELVQDGKQRSPHLELLEMTIGRMCSRTVAVLDPVLCCLAGSFGRREQRERNLIVPRPAPTAEQTTENADGDSANVQQRLIHESGLLRYGLVEVNRTNRTGQDPLPRDTIIRPPKLPVIGHSFRNWSGVRRDGEDGRVKPTYPLDPLDPLGPLGPLDPLDVEKRAYGYFNVDDGQLREPPDNANDYGNPNLNRRRFADRPVKPYETRDYLERVRNLKKGPGQPAQE